MQLQVKQRLKLDEAVVMDFLDRNDLDYWVPKPDYDAIEGAFLRGEISDTQMRELRGGTVYLALKIEEEDDECIKEQ